MKRPSRLSPITIAGILITTAFLALSLKSPAIIDETVESLLLDYRFISKSYIEPAPKPADIVIVAIDEASLDRHGRWPWRRDLQARLISAILSGEPKVLAADVFYSEPETDETDRMLGEVVEKASGRLVLAAGFDSEAGLLEPPDYLLDSAITKVRNRSKLSFAHEVTRTKLKVAPIYSRAVLGHVVSPPDMDGKLRREHLYIKFGEDFYPSFALVAAALSMGKGISDITIQGDNGVSVGDTFIPTDPAGRMRVNYLGGEETFARISAADILDGKVSPSSLAGKIVFMGTSAISTYDFMVTPFSARTPAVEKNATVTENIVHSRFIQAAPLTVASALVAASGLLLSFVLPRIRAALGISLAFFMLGLFTAANFMLFAKRGIYLNFIYPFLNMAVISIVFGSYKYFAEEKRSKELKRMFSSYVSPKIVAELMSNPEMAKLGGYRREVSILFSDLRGFTTFSENRDPEEVVSMLNEYFKEMTDIIFRWDGTLDKFVGDEIMAFWGAPAIQPNHAELAVRCALEMSDRLDKLQNRWRDEGKYVLDCGIGINTGTVLIGNIGAVDKKMDYTAIGDNVNLGARVEALTRKYEARILITEFTQSKIADLIGSKRIGHVELVEADTVKVKGKEIPVRIYRLTPLAHAH